MRGSTVPSRYQRLCIFQNIGKRDDQVTGRLPRSRPLFNTAANTQAQVYFSSADDNVNRITCTSVDIPAPAPPEKSKFRIRGISDDLYIDRSEENFKSTSQATLTSTGNRSAIPTQNLKAKAALGYAFEGETITTIPYVSFYQSITDTFGKPQSTDPASNVAAGMLFTSNVYGLISQTISAKPQYLLNTKDHSEIGSLRLIYTPYTGFTNAPNLNLFQQLPFFPTLSAQIQFDLDSMPASMEIAEMIQSKACSTRISCDQAPASDWR